MANEKITLKEIAARVATRTGEKKSLIESILKEGFSQVSDSLNIDGVEVAIHNFGTFRIKDRAERQGRNPKTGEALTIPASKSVSFKATKHG